MLTDGHLSGLVCKGLVVAEVAPEAAVGGPLALVEDGDRITIDLDGRGLDVPEQELQARRARWQAPGAATTPAGCSSTGATSARSRKGAVLTGAQAVKNSG